LKATAQPSPKMKLFFHKMTYPKSFTNLQGFIGFIRFYQDYIPLYEVRIHPFRELLKEASSPGIMDKQEEVHQQRQRPDPEEHNITKKSTGS
jgi:hypothetical protein